ncbi:aminotransferase class I/II-fold pyridoxal phosphate-dependent enzyme [Streptococcus suis]|uniref:aminotransferase class I/II-fold pyridoxal phosphate-dependent enzyme n=1 Tax=Streptococcus suis TaxID=1307 RepID=UPI0005CF7095|nr:aminotransferase class I/II-fold pyridoxal phosphate-dependent enzyme [Streptococcus suis]NQR92567.1 aminotransferase class I/II-fold pyridoxal phosphate-dependent enzyme [Streptococcus suis]CYX72454.1 aspartate aminotransferase [Streptococcus suis]
MINKLNFFDSPTENFAKFMNKNTIQISGWDLMDNKIFKLTELEFLNPMRVEDYTNYTYPIELKELKTELINQDRLDILQERLGIFPNATSIAYSLLSYFRKKHQNVLIISPCYYAYSNILVDLNYNIYVSMLCNLEELKESIILNKIDLIIFTEPLFVSNRYLLKHFVELLKWGRAENVNFIVDCLYNNLNWEEEFKSFLSPYNSILKHENLSIIESLSKKIQLNGVKNAVLISRPEIIKYLEESFNYTSTPFSYSQLALLKYYCEGNIDFFNRKIQKLKEKSQENYQLLTTMLSGTEVLVDNVNSGYFTVLNFPYGKFNQSGDENMASQIAIDLLKKWNIFTIPHLRYHYNKEGYYSFRINLTLDNVQIYEAIVNLLRYFNLR